MEAIFDSVVDTGGGVGGVGLGRGGRRDCTSSMMLVLQQLDFFFFFKCVWEGG